MSDPHQTDDTSPADSELDASGEADRTDEAATVDQFVMPAEAYETIATGACAAVPMDLAEPAAPAGPDAGELIDAIQAIGADLGARLDAIQRVVDRESRAEATREKVVDRLHAELQEHKQDLLLRMMRPMFLDMIQLHDDMGKILEASRGAAEPGEIEPRAECPPEPGTPTADRLLHLIRGFQQGIEDLLYRQGVEPFTVDAPTFDPRQQRAVATVAAGSEEDARTISTRVRPGFRSGDRVIRPELVRVQSWNPRKA